MLGFIDHLLSDYPFGIGKSILKNARARQEALSSREGNALLSSKVVKEGFISWGKERAKLCFLCDEILDDPYHGTEGELLRAVIEKGLKLKVEEVRLICPEAGRLVDMAEVSKMGQACIISLGCRIKQREGQVEEFPRGIIQEELGTKFLMTYSLREVLEEPAVKKEFWEHLKVILPFIQRSN